MVLAAVLIHCLSVIAIDEDDYEGDDVGVFMLMSHGDVDDDHDDEEGDAVDDDDNVLRGVDGYHTSVPRGASRCYTCCNMDAIGLWEGRDGTGQSACMSSMHCMNAYMDARCGYTWTLHVISHMVVNSMSVCHISCFIQFSPRCRCMWAYAYVVCMCV